MKRNLPHIEVQRFSDELQLIDSSLSPKVHAALFEHYEELKRWNARLSLVGPGTVEEVMERHYGESLAALPLLGSEDKTLVDLGSGGGFPGFVLAAALPDTSVVLIEARQKKWAFLRTAIRRSGLSCTCLNARVETSLPQGTPDKIDVLTCRAVAVTPKLLNLVRQHSPNARFLLWLGASQPELPEGMTVLREVPLVGSTQRRIVEIGPVS